MPGGQTRIWCSATKVGTPQRYVGGSPVHGTLPTFINEAQKKRQITAYERRRR
ncbi:hypothetical protein [Nocardiopsis synnemataformans]|uniref:hypothetical protein n=1 Tax=Nocardiopsis synnemataformans TaxID=61305 RepID=UPI003EB899CA